MQKVLITRRMLLAAGVAAGIAAVIPLKGLLVSLPEEDLLPIGAGASDTLPYNSEVIGSLSTADSALLSRFAQWAIEAWGFESIGDYASSLPSVLGLKTSQQPSYLNEYQSAARLIESTLARLESANDAFLYLMFTPREKELGLDTRLGRANHFVFQELLRHMLASGGFKQFGFANFNGYIHLPFADKDAYRRGPL